MGVLTGLQPEKVFSYFEQICAIPHGSTNTKQLSDYCVRFAEERGLRCIQDEADNVIIFKNGTEGYEDSAPVMLQGHLDMVCEKTAECKIDFEKDGLTLKVDDGIIRAEGTTLGGDDGIAIAYALAILDSDDIPHPPLEVVFTSDEEIGMLGAVALDFSQLESRIMLNIDSEDEGYLLVSCAGGSRVDCKLPMQWESVYGIPVDLKITGLAGGHSGVEIHKESANSNRLMGRLLCEINKKVDFNLVSVCGGLKDNAIPRETTAKLMIQQNTLTVFQQLVEEYCGIFANEYRTTDPELTITAEIGQSEVCSAMTNKCKRDVISALVLLPCGVQRMSTEIKGMVQTSLNMGILKTEEENVSMSFALRSSVGTEREEMVSRIAQLMQILGGTMERSGDYPAWEYQPESPLRDLMCEVFEEQYGHAPVVHAIHAGVECGLFAGALPGLDCVSFGPDLKDIHTVRESMDAASVQRTWEFLLEVLKRLK